MICTEKMRATLGTRAPSKLEKRSCLKLKVCARFPAMIFQNIAIKRGEQWIRGVDYNRVMLVHLLNKTLCRIEVVDPAARWFDSRNFLTCFAFLRNSNSIPAAGGTNVYHCSHCTGRNRICRDDS